MKKDLMEILACPVCHGELVLTVEREEAGEIVSGSLYCAQVTGGLLNVETDHVKAVDGMPAHIEAKRKKLGI